MERAEHLHGRGDIAMGFYSDVILPRLCDVAMRNKRLLPYREHVISAAEGRVIEIGIGSGLNLPFYRPSVREVLALEPSPKLVAMARRAPHPGIPVGFIEASAEAIPLDGHRKPRPRSPKCAGCFGTAGSFCLSSTGWRRTRAC